MKAGIYLGRKNIEVREFDMPEVRENDVLIQNIYSSICGTDVAVYTKGTLSFPIFFGLGIIKSHF